MNKLAQLGVAATLLMGLNTPSTAAFLPFAIDANSTSFAGADLTTNEYLDFIGNSFIKNTFAGPIAPGAAFTFVDTGVFKVTGVDGAPQTSFGGNEITASFSGSGSGILGGAINFTAGVLKFYSDAANDYATAAGSAAGIYGANNGTLIGTFNLTSGSANIDNNALPNGAISLTFQAASLLANTWFSTAGEDLSLNPNTFNFVTSNATRLSSASALLVKEIVCEQGGAHCPNGTGFNNAPTEFLVSNNGQDRMSYVPEPASLTLLGMALLGFGASRKSRRHV